MRLWVSACLNRLRGEINWLQMGWVALLCAPWIVLSALTQEPLWLYTNMVTIGCYIAAERGGLSVGKSVLQLLGIVLSFWLLFYTLSQPVGFILLCALFAVGITWLGHCSSALRSVATFTFIPALYLACEQGGSLHTMSGVMPGTMSSLLSQLPYLLLGGVPVFLMLAAKARLRQAQPVPTAPASLSYPPRHGSHLLTAAVSVALAALLVEWIHFAHGQWLIWSAASVAVGELPAYRHKFSQRAKGVLCGVPMGIAPGTLIPPNPLIFHCLSLAIMLSLVSFSRYAVGFGVRCGLIALSLTLDSGSMGIASERIVDVLLGGAIALGVMWGISYGQLWYQRMYLRH